MNLVERSDAAQFMRPEWNGREHACTEPAATRALEKLALVTSGVRRLSIE